MSVDLSTYVDTLKRQVIPLGGAAPTGVTSSTWTRYLVDAFWQARLDGLLEGYTVNTDGAITPLEEGDEDLDLKWVALIVLYAAIAILGIQILNTKAATKFRAKAGPVEFEQENTISATVLAEMLKQLRATKTAILEEVGELDQTPTYYLDAYSVRTFDAMSYWGSPELT